jgi:nucleoside-diphosphate-sugar epimerase
MSNVLLSGSTGMIGKGLLLECIKSPLIKSIILINRSPIDIQNPKINEIILQDFLEIDSIKNKIKNIDACYHCMGVSAMRLSEEQYSKFTFDITKKLADVCFDLNPKMTFIYVSGAGTDSTEKGRQMWARVKGKTENYILAKGFDKAYIFRPGFIIPENGIKSRTKLYERIYTFMRPFFPVLKKLNNVTTTSKIGLAMINLLIKPKNDIVHFDNKQINKIADQRNE